MHSASTHFWQKEKEPEDLHHQNKMKVSPPPTTAARKGKRRRAPISLVPPTTEPLKKGDYLSLRLRSVPGADDSMTYEIHVPYYRGGEIEN